LHCFHAGNSTRILVSDIQKAEEVFGEGHFALFDLYGSKVKHFNSGNVKIKDQIALLVDLEEERSDFNYLFPNTLKEPLEESGSFN
jgi:hypothetical protein